MSILALIPARGASKGLARKNVRVLAGKPMIVWSIEAALQSGLAERVVVSTDDDEIARISVRAGAEVPFVRPAALASDTTTTFEVVLQALQALERIDGYCPQFVLLLQPTSPLRIVDDIHAAVRLRESRDADSVVSVAEAPHPPHWLQTMDEHGILRPYAAGAAPARRQDSPKTYCPNGAVYLVRTDALKKNRSFSLPHSLAYVMPPERSVDIDGAFDILLAEFLLRERLRPQQ